MGVQGIGQPVGGDGGIRAEIRNVHPGVDSRVRAAAARHVHRMPHNHGRRLFQGLGDSWQVLLNLPTVIRRTQIC